MRLANSPGWREASLIESMWAFRDSVQERDLAGFDVEAVDGHIGKVDEASGDACLVIDTGFWIFGKQRMLPAGFVMRVDPHDGKVYVALTREEVKGLPDLDTERHCSDESAYHREMEPHYRADWESRYDTAFHS
jgi:hypothetical protein